MSDTARRLLAIWEGPKVWLFAAEGLKEQIVWSGGSENWAKSVDDILNRFHADWAFYSISDLAKTYGNKFQEAYDEHRPPDWAASDVSVEWNNKTNKYDFSYSWQKNKIQSECQCSALDLIGRGHLPDCPCAPKPKKFSYL
jgi:hypothetical protein